MSNESKLTESEEHASGAPAAAETRSRPERLPYEPPMIESSEVFESFTLQSCNQFPNECGGALE